MKEITKYIADDGTEFDDEFECLKHEMSKYKNGLLLFNKNRNYEVEFLPWEECCDSEFVIVKSLESYEIFRRMYGELYGVKSTGIYIWNTETDSYVLLDEKIETLKKYQESLLKE